MIVLVGNAQESVSIHALLAECDSGRKNSIYLSVVSIHALLAECDWHRGALREFEIEFQSTHSLRSATEHHIRMLPIEPVSIHALLAECDPLSFQSLAWGVGFNPRTPCGVRPDTDLDNLSVILFQSTHSLRSATYGLDAIGTNAVVSIHALLAECDRLSTLNFHFSLTRFNPRTPCGVRLPSGLGDSHPGCFNPRTPCGVRREEHKKAGRGRKRFQSTHSLRSATK